MVLLPTWHVTRNSNAARAVNSNCAARAKLRMLSSSGQSGGNLIAHCAQHTCMEGRSSFERSLFPICWLIHVSTFSCRFLAKLAKCWLTRLSGECEILAGHWTLHPDTLILRLIPQLQAELYQHTVSKLEKILLLFLKPVMHRTIWAVPVVSVQSLMSNWTDRSLFVLRIALLTTPSQLELHKFNHAHSSDHCLIIIITNTIYTCYGT